ncbi:MAG: LamG domain-containing protein [Planctomycetota bacterium]
MCRRLVCLTFLVFVLGLSTAPFGSDAQAGLIGYWKLDDASGTIAADDAGGDNNGTLIGDEIQWVEGRAGGALSHLGMVDTDDGVEFPTTGMSTTAGTVAMWSYLADPQAPTSGRYFFGHTTQPQFNNRIQLFMQDADTSNPTTLLDVGLGDSHNLKNDIVELPLEEWVHVGLTWDSGTYGVFVNGEEVATGSYTGLAGLHPVANIGNDGSSAPYEAFVGKLDEVRLYDNALSAGEMQAAMKIAAFPQASGPNPKDGTLLMETWATLTWRPGDFAVSHDVYIGDNFDDVNNGTPGAPGFIGNQMDTLMVVGFPGFAIPDGLVPGTTYYWRIDEVNDANAASPWKGDIWSFSIAPKTAYNPDPADGAEFVATDATLSWTPGYGAKLHTVYMGTDFDAVDNAAGGAPQGTATYKPASLEVEKVYYWRVDEFDALATYKGDVWGFTTPGAAGSLQPANGATDVQINSTLNWMPATTAVSHDVYVGTDKDAVRNATTASPEYKGNRASGSESYDPGKLAWNSNYYWRIDAVYNTGSVKGLVWNFTTADFLLVDDFESYNDIDPPDPNSNRIFDKWIDGFGTTTNGALVGNDLPPYAEQTVVHSGTQSMPYSYDNNLKTSEATLTLVYPRDWTEEGVAKLSLWFRGASANSAERMYVALNGNAVVYHDDPAVTQKTGWTRWVIDLQAFANQGVNLANVNTIPIGIGTKNSPAAGGAGTMYFDDIRLYR